MKSAQESAQKYAERAAAATQDYVSGAESTSKDQAQNAIAAKGTYASQVQAAITAGRYEKGLAKSGKSKWANGIRTKGSARYAGGVSEGAADYAQNSGAYDGARKAADSLPRGPRGSEQNFTRSKTVGQALNKLKMSR